MMCQISYIWKCLLLVLIWCVMQGANTQAQSFKYKSSEASEIIHAPALGVHGLPDTLIVWCNDWDFITSHPTTWRNNIKLKSNQTFVRFAVNNFDSVTSYLQHIGYLNRLSYTIYGFYDPADTISGYTVLNDTLTISYDNNISFNQAYQDLHVKKYGNFYKAKIVITGVYAEDLVTHALSPVHLTSSPVSNRIYQNFYVEGAIVTQRYDKDKYGITAPVLHTSAFDHEDNNFLSVFWNYSVGDTSPVLLTPVSYELEWTYVDDYDLDVSTGSSSFLSSSDVRYDFSGNSTKVWVDSNYYRIPLVYNSGYLVYRVRPVRPDSNQYHYPIYGPWSVANSSGVISSLPGESYYHLNAPYMHDSANWQYTISFSEGGRYKHLLGFYDGLLKLRQSITRFNSNLSKLIAVQNIYDYAGSPSIKTLPTPINCAGFSYRYDLAVNAATGGPYQAIDFDTGFALCPTVQIIPSLSDYALSNLYYSANNPDSYGINKFIPNANGYPLTQIVYKAGYNRPEHIGGAGSDLQIGTGNATDYSYTGSDQVELNRLFGQNIGWKEFYTSTYTRDPNKQLSLSVKNYKGKPVLSALVGPGPDSSSHAILTVDLPEAFSVSRDLLFGVTQEVIDNSKIADYDYFNQTDGFDSLQYSFNYDPYPLCPGQSLGVKAHYHYEVTDQCGDIVVSRDSIVGSNGMISGPLAYTGPLEIFAAAVAPYHVHKEFTIDPIDVNAALDSFFALPPSCFSSQESFIRRSVKRRQFPCAGESSDPCVNKKWQMMQELFPMAKYGQYTMVGDSVVGDSNSIFTITGTVGGPIKPFYRYQDTCTSYSLPNVMTINGITCSRLRTMRTDSFLAIYEMALAHDDYRIAEDLLPLHPEYCMLRACFNDSFKTQVLAIPDAKLAESMNRLYLDSLVNHDPFVNTMSAYFPLHPDDSLRTFKGGHIRLDSFVLVNAYCGCNDSVMYRNCVSDMFSDEITEHLLINDAIKKSYFDQVIETYFANRQRFVDAVTMAAGDSCSHCAAVRMALTPMPIFDHTISSTGAPIIDSTIGYSSFSCGGSFLWLGSTALADSMDSTMQALYDTAVVHYNFADSGLCYGQIDTIIARLANCIVGDTVKLAGIRNTLDSLCAAHAIKNGNYSPQQIRYAILRNCDSTTDLCNPYLVNYTNFPGGSTSELDCEPDTFFNAATAFLNDTAVKHALAYPGSIHSFTLSTINNVFEDKINTLLGNSSVRMISSYDSSNKKITLKVYKNPAVGGTSLIDTLKIFYRSPIFGNVFAYYVDSCNIQALCINSDPQPMSTGEINKYSFLGHISTTTALTTFSTSLLGWVDSINTISSSSNLLSGCVPCTQMKELYIAFMDTLTAYHISGIDHPYYYAMLGNFMNSRLKQQYSTDQYERFIESCALADSMHLPRYFGYSTFSFSSVGAMDSFMTALNRIDSDYMFNTNAYRDSSSTGIIRVSVNINMVDVWELWKYKSFFNGYSGSYVSKVVNLPFSATQSPNALGFLYTPVSDPFSPADSAICNVSDSVTYVHSNKKVWMYGSFYPVDFYDVFHTPTAPPYRISKNEYDHQQYLYNAGLSWVRYVKDFEHTIDKDYFKPEKAAYLRYTYGYEHLPPYEVLDSIQPQYLVSRIPSYSSYDAAYSNLFSPELVTNLYLSRPGMVNRYFDTLKKMLYTVQDSNTINPGYIFFDTNKVVVINNIDSPLIAYRCSDGAYYYRYFGGNDTLYNAFLAFPSYIPQYMHKYYQIVDVLPALGDSTSRFFKVTLQIPGDTTTVEALGLTTFVIGKNIELDDVLLGNPIVGGSVSGGTDTFNNCERYRLNNAIAAGVTEYHAYVDSMMSAIRAGFTAYLGDNVTEKLILSSMNNSFGYTLYDYDRAGNLISTVSPMGVQPLDIALSANIDAARSSNSPGYTPSYFQQNVYQYNSLDQPFFQKTVNGGNTFFYYDPASRLVLSQNDKQRAVSKYTYYAHDRQGRVIETGQVPLSSPFPPSYDPDSFVTYIRSFDRQDVILTVYDTAARDMYVLAQADSQQNLRKRVAAILYFDGLFATDTLFNGYTYATHYSYDIDGNLKTLVHDYPRLQAMKQRYKRVDYDYDLISGKVNMLSYNRGFSDQFYHRYSYDDDNRLVSVQTSQNGYIWKRDAAYQYYDYGPLARVDVGDLRVQGIDYAYTIQGWLKAVNGDTVGVDLDMGQDGTVNGAVNAADAIAYTIDYFNADYSSITGWQMQHVPAASKSLYNGNISKHTLGMMAFPRYTLYKEYLYDQFNRLKNADYSFVNADAGTLTPTDGYKNDYSYDLNGNIVILDRWGDASPGGMSPTPLMDMLQYDYYGTSDKLQDIAECAPDHYTNDLKYHCSTDTRYKYDEVGNTTMDLVNAQDDIKWNLYNKVLLSANYADASTLTFEYDGMGNRVYKSYVKLNNWGNTVRSDYYVRDAQENILAIYHSYESYDSSNHLKGSDYALAEHDIYGSSRIGVKNYLYEQYGGHWSIDSNIEDTLKLTTRVPWYSLEYQDLINRDSRQPYGNTFNDSLYVQHIAGQKQYELTDHLGNVLTTVSDSRSARTYDLYSGIPLSFGNPALVTSYNPCITQAFDYYPFGMMMPGRIYNGSDSFQSCLTATIDEPVHKWMPISSARFNTGCIPCGLDTINLSSLAFTTNNVAVTDTYRHTMNPSPLPSTATLLYGNWMLRRQLHGLHVGVRNRVTLYIHSVTTPDSARFPVKVFVPSGTSVALGNLPTAGPSTFTAEFLSTASADSVVTFAVGWQRLFDTVHMPYGYSVILDSVMLEYDTTVLLPIASNVCGEDKYEYGYNGQMKVNEWAGTGNHNTALFGELDTRTGRRWNRDPKPNFSLSDYTVFGDNPIATTDVLLDSPIQMRPASAYNYGQNKESWQKMKDDLQYIFQYGGTGPIERWKDIYNRDHNTPQNTSGREAAEVIEGVADAVPLLGPASRAMNGGKTAIKAVSAWSLGPGPRGLAIEVELGGNLPANFPVVDRWANGIATSIKSIDLGASTYQDVSRLSSVVNGYINKVAGFNGASLSGVTIDAAAIQSRALNIAIPSGVATAAQMRALQQAVQTGASKNVTVIITQVK